MAYAQPSRQPHGARDRFDEQISYPDRVRGSAQVLSPAGLAVFYASKYGNQEQLSTAKAVAARESLLGPHDLRVKHDAAMVISLVTQTEPDRIPMSPGPATNTILPDHSPRRTWR
jgi:hypothetical protein